MIKKLLQTTLFSVLIMVLSFAAFPPLFSYAQLLLPEKLGIGSTCIGCNMVGGTSTGTAASAVYATNATSIALGQYSASYFGILPSPTNDCSTAGWYDTTTGFQNLATFYTTLLAGQRPKIIFPAGTFCASSISLLAPANGALAKSYPTINWEGAGYTETRITATSGAPTPSVFFSVDAAFMQGAKIYGIGFYGNAANTAQDGGAIFSDVLLLNNSGGITGATLSQLEFYNFTGRGLWTKGGAFNSNFPIQLLDFNTVIVNRPTGDGYPALEMFGQSGQINFINSEFQGTSENTNGGANTEIGADPRWQKIQPTLECTTGQTGSPCYGASFFRSNSYYYPSETALRVVPVQGQTLLFPSYQGTSAVAIGTTYWLTRFNMWGDTATDDTDFTLSTTSTLAGDNISSTTGATAVSGNTLTLATANASLAAGQNITIANAGALNNFKTGNMTQYAPFTCAISSVVSTTVTLTDTPITAFSGQAYAYAAAPVIPMDTAGTHASYQFVPIWSSTPLLDSNSLYTILTMSENHRLVTGDPMMPVGLTTNINNANLSVATVYYVRRVNHTQWQLYDTYAHAIALTSTTGLQQLTGNATDWNNFGFVLNNGTQTGLESAYTILWDNVTCQNSETCSWWNDAQDVRITPHIETSRRGIEAYNQSFVTVLNGHFATSRDAGRGSLGYAAGLSNIVFSAQPYGIQYDRFCWGVDSGYCTIDPKAPFTILNDSVNYGPRTISDTAVSVSSNILAAGHQTNIPVTPSANYIGAISSYQFSGSKMAVNCGASSPYYCDFYAAQTFGNTAVAASSTYAFTQNLQLGGASRLRLYSGSSAIFQLTDTGSFGWNLIGTSGNVRPSQFFPAAASGSFTATTGANTTLTVSGCSSNCNFNIGQTISAGTITGSPYITAFGANTTGGNGTYTISGSAQSNGATATATTITYVTPIVGGGDVDVDLLPNALTVNAPSGNPLLGQTLTLHFVEGGSGGYSITMNSAYAGIPDTIATANVIAGGTTNQEMFITFKYNTAGKWSYQTSSGWTSTIAADSVTGPVAATTLTATGGTLSTAGTVPFMLDKGGVAVGVAPTGNFYTTTGALIIGSEGASVSLVLSGGTCTTSCPANATGITLTCTGCFGGTSALDTGKVITINDSGTWKTITVTGNSGSSANVAQGTIGTQATSGLTYTTGNWEMTDISGGLPAPFSTGTGLYLVFPATSNLTGANSVLGFWTTCTYTTICTVYNSTFTPTTAGDPATGTTTAFSGLTGTTYTGISTAVTLRTITLPANTLSANGFVELMPLFSTPANTNTKTTSVSFGAISSSAGNAGTTLTAQSDWIIRNAGSTSAQLNYPAAYTPFGNTNTSVQSGTVNTGSNVSIVTTCADTTSGADYCILDSQFIRVTP
jgi:hypothetical protein